MYEYQSFAVDSETDCKSEEVRAENINTVCVQICPPIVGGRELCTDDTRLYFDDDNAYIPFLRGLEDEQRNIRVQAYNLPYEWNWLHDALITLNYRFVNCDIKDLNSPRSVAVMNDKGAGVIHIRITNEISDKGKYHYMDIKDSSKLLGGKFTMKQQANTIRDTYPDWWMNVPNVKEDTIYNDGWYYRKKGTERYDSFVHYSRVDAVSQALIMRYLDMTGQSKGLTSSSNSYHKAVCLSLGTDNEFSAMRKYRNIFKTLSIESQLQYQNSGLGGMVYDRTGIHRMKNGSKLDYKSSYPAGYWEMVAPRDKEGIVYPEDWSFDDMHTNESRCVFLELEFDFEIKGEEYAPCINAGECSMDGVEMNKGLRLKMKKGHHKRAIMPEPYLDAIRLHYDITNITYYSKRVFLTIKGFYRPAIRRFFVEKEVSEGVERSYNKMCMNGGMHGKNITKIGRKKRIYSENGREEEWSEVELEQSKDPYHYGMWIMMGRRAKLLTDWYSLIKAGKQVYMTDTDSIITDASYEELKEIFPDLITKELKKELDDLADLTIEGRKERIHKGWDAMSDKEKDKMIDRILGKFEVEQYGITEFRSWGNKRYICYGKDVKGKEKITTAFAGMSDGEGWYFKDGERIHTEHLQKDLLDIAGMDGYFEYEQKGLVSTEGRFGKPVMIVHKKARCEDIWFHDGDEEMLKSITKLMRL